MDDDDDKGENEFPANHPFNNQFYAMPQYLSNMQDKLIAKVPTWERVSFVDAQPAELKVLFERMRAAFPPEETYVSLPIYWDWSDPAEAFESPLFDDAILEANKRQKHESEHYLL